MEDRGRWWEVMGGGGGGGRWWWWKVVVVVEHGGGGGWRMAVDGGGWWQWWWMVMVVVVALTCDRRSHMRLVGALLVSFGALSTITSFFVFSSAATAPCLFALLAAKA